MRTEVWKAIPSFEGRYSVSNLGRVRSHISGIILRGTPNNQGYQHVKLYKEEGGYRTLKVHRLVLEAFVGPATKGQIACHKDDDPGNNTLENLRWDTHSENQKDRVRNGTYTNGRKEKTHCKRGHALRPPNLRRGSLKRGVRNCRACDLARGQIAKRQRTDKTMQELSDEKYQKIMKR